MTSGAARGAELRNRGGGGWLRNLGPQPVVELGVGEQLASFCLIVVRHQDPDLDRADGTLDDAHVAVCDLVRDVSPAEQTLDDRDQARVVCPDQLCHVGHLRRANIGWRSCYRRTAGSAQAERTGPRGRVNRSPPLSVFLGERSSPSTCGGGSHAKNEPPTLGRTQM